MGGIGSGRWQHHERALTVEACQVLDLRNLRNRGLLQRLGPDVLDAYLTVGDAPSIQVIPLVRWTPGFGGCAWRMTCPRCRCNCQKLYRPPQATRDACPFRCRRCWKLTYTSAQEAHRWDRGSSRAMLLSIAEQEGLPIDDVLQILTGQRRGLGPSRGLAGPAPGGELHRSISRPPDETGGLQARPSGDS
jgi:hypothetical protein